MQKPITIGNTLENDTSCFKVKTAFWGAWKPLLTPYHTHTNTHTPYTYIHQWTSSVSSHWRSHRYIYVSHYLEIYSWGKKPENTQDDTNPLPGERLILNSNAFLHVEVLHSIHIHKRFPSLTEELWVLYIYEVIHAWVMTDELLSFLTPTAMLRLREEQTELTRTHSPQSLPSSCVRCGCQWTPQCAHGSCRPPQRSCRHPCPRKVGCPRWRWCPREADWSPGRRSYHLSAAADVSGRQKEREEVNVIINPFLKSSFSSLFWHQLLKKVAKIDLSGPWSTVWGGGAKPGSSRFNEKMNGHLWKNVS